MPTSIEYVRLMTQTKWCEACQTNHNPKAGFCDGLRRGEVVSDKHGVDGWCDCYPQCQEALNDRS